MQCIITAARNETNETTNRLHINMDNNNKINQQKKKNVNVKI